LWFWLLRVRVPSTTPSYPGKFPGKVIHFQSKLRYLGPKSVPFYTPSRSGHSFAAVGLDDRFCRRAGDGCSSNAEIFVAIRGSTCELVLVPICKDRGNGSVHVRLTLFVQGVATHGDESKTDGTEDDNNEEDDSENCEELFHVREKPNEN
jgi:hypothetical protein